MNTPISRRTSDTAGGTLRGEKRNLPRMMWRVTEGLIVFGMMIGWGHLALTVLFKEWATAAAAGLMLLGATYGTIYYFTLMVHGVIQDSKAKRAKCD